MTQVLITDQKRPQIVFEFRHNRRTVPNTAYAKNAVSKAINKAFSEGVTEGVQTVELDATKLKAIEYTSTEVFIYDRHGALIISSVSRPQHGDRFSKAEGRKYALLNALGNLKFRSSHPDFKDLLVVKLFLHQFEIKAKDYYPHWDWANVLVTWEYIDLFNALLAVKEGKEGNRALVLEAAVNLVGQANFDKMFYVYVNHLLDVFNSGNTEFDIHDAYHTYSYLISNYYEILKATNQTLDVKEDE